ncbi:replication protein A 70 kDa DNA-binding subunit C-like [Vigna unguiculata]|uniref:replication protein A 70 kDa DNA-binding subunit C-like n=1 Tax=Vigna unguiculata TaxID=3917 RepID=UPI001016BF7C|nr:replication protein A 70 kDa DNA-binding subunit C-like [Vigna unguiculata]
MAKKLDMIKDIDGRRETLKLGVRVLDLWYIHNRESNVHLEMILIDQMGDKIHCIVKKDEFDIWDGKLKEGDTYIMHNFKIVKNDGQYRVCDHPFKLLFIGATSVRPQPIANIPNSVYQFRSIKEVVASNFSPDLLIDLIGWVDNVKAKAQSKNVVFSLMDLSGGVVSCTLWDEYCKKFLERYNDNPNSNKLVLILTQAKVKAATGEWPVSVSNTWNGTKLLMDDAIPEITQFKQRMSADDLTIMSQSGSQLTQSSQYSDAERFVYKCLVKSVSEIPLIKKEMICVTVATTTKFSLDNDGWYYLVCNHCNKRTNETGPFKCTYCDQDNNMPTLKYKLQLQVCDDAFNYANFVVWDQKCRNIIGISAEELQKKMIKVGEDDPKCFPDELDVMLGCTLAFKLRTQPRNKFASVIKVSDLPEIINYIKKLIQPLGECSHKNIIDLGGDTSTGMIVDFRSKGVCNLAANSDHDLMSLSGTADNDPDNSSLGTPSKRIVPNSGVSVQSSEDIESGELSATKPMKTIKQEID